jgi:hypothetical protein
MNTIRNMKRFLLWFYVLLVSIGILCFITISGCDAFRDVTGGIKENHAIKKLKKEYPGHVFIDEIEVPVNLTDVQAEEYNQRMADGKCFGIGEIENIRKVTLFDNVISIFEEYISLEMLSNPDKVSYKELLKITNDFVQSYTQTMVRMKTDNWSVILGSSEAPETYTSYNVGESVIFVGTINKVDFSNKLIFLSNGSIIRPF